MGCLQHHFLLVSVLFAGTILLWRTNGKTSVISADGARRRLKCVWQNWKHQTVCDTGGGGGGANKPPPPTPNPGNSNPVPHPPARHPQGPTKRCAGGITVAGHGPMEIINSHGSLASADSAANAVNVPVHSLSFVGETCNAKSQEYSNKEYSKLLLLGKSMSWTVDLSKVGCKCIATMYLVPMASNDKKGSMGNFYCDANAIGGVNCAELDMEESNRHAFHSVLHTSHDTDGKNGGYGGGEWSWDGPRDWDKARYGPGASCIDTLKPFHVHIAFPMDGAGNLDHLKTKLTQNGCSVQSKNIGAGGGRFSYDAASMKELTETLKSGVTPVLSHFNPSKIAWLVGVGKDKAGPCDANMVKNAVCGDAVFSNIQVHAATAT